MRKYDSWKNILEIKNEGELMMERKVKKKYDRRKETYDGKESEKVLW